MISLRPYQREAIDALWRYFETSDGSPLLVLPTGSGKTIVLAAFAREALAQYPSTRILVLTHVRELVSQDAAKLEALLPPRTVGVYSAGLRRRELGRAVTVASVQSLARNLRKLSAVDLVIVDEAHLIPPSGEGQYRTLLASLRALNPMVKVIGLTATPFRLKSGYLHEGDGRVFTDIAHEVEIRPLIDAGYLCPLRSKGGTAPDLDGVHTRGGEYVQGEMEAAYDRDELIGATLDEVEDHCAERKKWIVFCAGVSHAEHVTEALRERGYAVALVTGETPRAERDAIIGAFKRGEVRALINVDVLTTGFDAPDIDAVILMRATKSAGLFCQMVGRGMRIHPSKQDALILDFGGNVLRHGPVDALTIRRREGIGGDAPVKACPECKEIVHASARQCPACGAAFEIASKGPHGVSATNLPVLNEPVELPVHGASYVLHRKDGKPDSVRVTYRSGLQAYSEWVCLEHGGYAQHKAAKWWSERGGEEPVPATAIEALGRTRELRQPATITVRREGEYWRVLSARLESEAA